ncbi:MAG TPA: hypothetical protein PLK27_07945 [Neisseria sp.]|nr:hypothetical protein [Neisseria sp.]
MDDLITIDEVIKLWTLPGKKPPCRATIWKYTREGKIPQPRLIGRSNVYKKAETIRLRNKQLGITDDAA